TPVAPGPAPEIDLLDDTSLAMVAVAMTAAIESAEPEPLAQWSAAFLEDVRADADDVRCPPVCRALLAAIRGAVRIRLGDVRAADAEACAALAEVEPGDWGILSGVPTIVRTLAAVAAGRLDDAAGHLETSMPSEMFWTMLGPAYLSARGRYRLATGSHSLALRDFEMCADAERQWHPDQPGSVMWRVGAAEACVGLGDHSRARELLAEHQPLLGGRRGRAYGEWLRVRAATASLGTRPAMLREAVEVLRKHDDQVAAARALSDLGDAHEARGERREAKRARRRASHLVRQFSEVPPGEPVHQAREGRPGGGRAAADDASELSDAERRVAALAARGYTNREIADRLYITMSTVEQHLTRSYRKLKVTSRADLPFLPMADVALN
ncbi:MAG: helix-turn-helix transcriptional regulator, partial [Nocardiopsaceae bacterium]|nr:helix-turn-helix transcriptional regulator [Nocardiopsaceae bacterium]